MRDYNFFQPFVGGTARRSGDDYFPVIPVILLMVLILAAWPGYNYYRLTGLKQEVDLLSADVLNHPDYGLLAEVSSQRGVVQDSRNRLTTAQKMDVALTASEWLDEELLTILLDVFPRDLAIDSLSLGSGGQIQLSGSATNKPAIAELEYNLRRTGRFENLHVPSIVRTASGRVDIFTFSLSMQVKGVGGNASN